MEKMTGTQVLLRAALYLDDAGHHALADALDDIRLAASPVAPGGPHYCDNCAEVMPEVIDAAPVAAPEVAPLNLPDPINRPNDRNNGGTMTHDQLKQAAVDYLTKAFSGDRTEPADAALIAAATSVVLTPAPK